MEVAERGSSAPRNSLVLNFQLNRDSKPYRFYVEDGAS